jgi:glycosyltransferase involved in cell wall biosynthesis
MPLHVPIAAGKHIVTCCDKFRRYRCHVSEIQNDMTDPRAGICLNMIVKNETKVLGRLLSSVRPHIDYYVIVDTGSTDGTQDFIRQWMDAAGIPGEVHERPWVSFGHNRQQALELAVAANKANWLLFIDADEELGVSDPEFHHKLQPGVTYQLEKHHGEIRYALPNLVDISENRWQWRAPVHEYLEHLEGSNRRELRKDAWIIFHEGEGARSQAVTTEEKYLRDAKALKQELRKNPRDTRSQFYLAQSYKHAGHLGQALEAYRKRAEMGGFEEEKFMAQLEVGRVSILMGKTEQIILQELLDAFDLRPRRAEPLHELARYFRLRKKYVQACVFARTGCELKRPDDVLFVDSTVYDWRLLDELAVSAYWTGEFAVSDRACRELLERVAQGVAVPAADLERIRQNHRFALDRLGQA